MLDQLVNQLPHLKQELTGERVARYQAHGAGITLSYATELVTEPILEGLFQLASEKKVLSQMQELQAGAIVNVSEHRAALHTALRLPTFQLAQAEIDKLEKALPLLDPFTDIVQVGIGGSLLGPEAVYLALKAYATGGRRAHFISNLDSDEATSVLKELVLSKTLFVIVSKSGTTVETTTNEAVIRSALIQQGLDPKMHLIAVTGQGSSMDDLEKYRLSFYIWDFIGGRYSTTSMVGGVMLSFVFGLKMFLQLLQGAHAMDLVALRENPRENLPLLGALLGFWNRTYLGYPTVAIIPYSYALSRFVAHLQQLEMESNGKRVNRQGAILNDPTAPIIWGEPGTNSQHSFFQAIHQGTTIIPVEFIGFQKSQHGISQDPLNGNMLAQAIALAQGKESSDPNQAFPGNRPSLLLLGKQCDAQTVGALLSYYENKVVFQGFLWDINSFDQWGVQLGKTVALQVIEAMAKKKGGSPIDPLLEKFISLFSC